MKLLFLDIDGVLNCKTTTERWNGLIGVDRRLASLFLEWLSGKDVGIVLSSTWRLYDDTKAQLSAVGLSWMVRPQSCGPFAGTKSPSSSMRRRAWRRMRYLMTAPTCCLSSCRSWSRPGMCTGCGNAILQSSIGFSAIAPRLRRHSRRVWQRRGHGDCLRQGLSCAVPPPTVYLATNADGGHGVR
jgi:hypothetical protein